MTALPLTRAQLDIWLAEETGRFGAKWQLGVLLRIEGPIEPGLFESAIRQVVREAEPLRAAFFEVDGQVFQKPIDYPDVELARYDLICSQDPVQDAYRLASSIQRTRCRLVVRCSNLRCFRRGLMNFIGSFAAIISS